ncbi:MAG: DoxX family protein [Chitinophagaceae bacterium]|nr:DoxX family protein [Chitinophagaceae bacterium]
MKKILATNSNNWTALFARLALGITIFPHGAQKLLGWFGGYGYTGTMGFLTTQAHLPWILAFLVIIIESIGALALIFGFGTRIAAFGMLANFVGILFTTHLNNGFFMNWSALANKGEGIEYFILVFGLAIVSLIAGGGKASVDAALTGKTTKVKSPVFVSNQKAIA